MSGALAPSLHAQRRRTIDRVTKPAIRIGMLREKPLHAALKRWYAEPGDGVEIGVGGYVIDLVRADLLIEIQTRGFSGMRSKVRRLLDAGHRLRIVHPIAVDRWLVQVDEDGTLLSRRRSPRHGMLADLATELVSLPDLVGRDGCEIEVVLTMEEEIRRHSPGRCWRRRGWIVVERRLLDVIDRVLIASPDDLQRLLPDGLPDPFTTGELAALLARPRRVGQQLAYCLRAVGVIESVGKRGHALEYRRAARELAAQPPRQVEVLAIG
jgi:hypothetical protein